MLPSPGGQPGSSCGDRCGADAFVVRMTVVPAVMALLGDKAWWLPRWLDRIVPNVDVEGEKLTKLLDETAPEDAGVLEPVQ